MDIGIHAMSSPTHSMHSVTSALRVSTSCRRRHADTGTATHSTRSVSKMTGEHIGAQPSAHSTHSGHTDARPTRAGAHFTHRDKAAAHHTTGTCPAAHSTHSVRRVNRAQTHNGSPHSTHSSVTFAYRHRHANTYARHPAHSTHSSNHSTYT
jgi:hypothetical protein